MYVERFSTAGLQDINCFVRALNLRNDTSLWQIAERDLPAQYFSEAQPTGPSHQEWILDSTGVSTAILCSWYLPNCNSNIQPNLLAKVLVLEILEGKMVTTFSQPKPANHKKKSKQQLSTKHHSTSFIYRPGSAIPTTWHQQESFMTRLRNGYRMPVETGSEILIISRPLILLGAGAIALAWVGVLENVF